jgi:hypothetical protein
MSKLYSPAILVTLQDSNIFFNGELIFRALLNNQRIKFEEYSIIYRLMFKIVTRIE